MYCHYLKQDAPSLDSAPFHNALGDYILHHISAPAWQAWKEHEIKLINEHRLALFKKADRDFLLQALKDFLRIEG